MQISASRRGRPANKMTTGRYKANTKHTPRTLIWLKLKQDKDGKISKKYKLLALTSGGLKSLSIYLSAFAWHEIYNLKRIGKLKDSSNAIYIFMT